MLRQLEESTLNKFRLDYLQSFKCKCESEADTDSAQASLRDSWNLSNAGFCLPLAGDGDYKPLVSSEPDVTTVEMDGSEVSSSIGSLYAH